MTDRRDLRRAEELGGALLLTAELQRVLSQHVAHLSSMTVYEVLTELANPYLIVELP